MKDLSILFVGSKDIGYHCLNELISRKEKIVGVVCRHDDPSEGQWYKSVTKLAQQNDLDVLRPADINDPKFVAKVAGLHPDILFCAQYPKILKAPLLQIPQKGCVNLHFAPLPKYRGCFPVSWAIINDEKQFGVTIHFMEAGVDSGDIIAQTMFEIKDSFSGIDLYRKCTENGLELFKKTFPLMKSGEVSRQKQDNSQATSYSREIPYNRTIDWSWKARKVHNFIRALYFPPFDSAMTFLMGKKVHIPFSKIMEDKGCQDGKQGEILEITEDGFLVKTHDICILIPQIQENNKSSKAYDYLLQHDIKIGCILGK
jgi:methionyl-tRNA formyltransferase